MNEKQNQYWQGVRERMKEKFGDDALNVMLFGSLWSGMGKSIEELEQEEEEERKQKRDSRVQQ